MSKKSVVFISLLFIVPVIVYFLWPSGNAGIRAVFKDGAKAVEQQKINDIMSEISLSYRDDHGLSYPRLKKLLENNLQEVKDIRVEYELGKIDVKGDSATADLNVRVMAKFDGANGFLIGSILKPCNVRFTLDKERKKWLITGSKGFPSWF